MEASCSAATSISVIKTRSTSTSTATYTGETDEKTSTANNIRICSCFTTGYVKPVSLQRVQKKCHYTLAYKFAKCWPIFKNCFTGRRSSEFVTKWSRHTSNAQLNSSVAWLIGPASPFVTRQTNKWWVDSAMKCHIDRDVQAGNVSQDRTFSEVRPCQYNVHTSVLRPTNSRVFVLIIF